MSKPSLSTSLGLLILRASFGLTMLIQHGLPKYQAFAEKADVFPDPLNIGNKYSLIATTSAEVICAGLVVIGLLTRIASLPLIFAMGVAAFVVHGEDPFGKKELAILYLAAFAVILFTGPGRLSLDQFLFRNRDNEELDDDELY